MRLNIEQMESIVWRVGSNQTDPELKKLRLDLVTQGFRSFMETGTGIAYGHVGGFLLAVHQYDVFNGRLKAYEFLFMVDPKAKQPNTATELLKEFEDGARAAGCETTVVGAHVGFSEWKTLERYYRMKGYSFLSESMQKIL